MLDSSWKLFALGSAFFAALTAIFGKLGVSEINSNLATFIRTIIVLIMSALIISFRREWDLPSAIGGKTYLYLTLSGLATGLSWLCYYHALKLGPASAVAPLDKLSVALVIIFSFIFLGEVMTIKTIIGGFLIVIGSLVLVI